MKKGILASKQMLIIVIFDMEYNFFKQKNEIIMKMPIIVNQLNEYFR